MAHILVRYKVKDFAMWRKIFQEHAAFRKQQGSQGSRVLQNADDPNDVAILLDWDTMEKARAFTESRNLIETMERAGVTGPPEITFLHSAGSFSE